MKKDDIQKAVSCAKAFLEAAKFIEYHQLGYANPGKRTGDLKRKSMDLTRSLAELRHPWRDASK